MIAEVTNELNNVEFTPDTTAEEILQNVRTILSTLKKTVPLDRDFGIDGEIIDLPTPVAQAKMTAEIVSAINKYEPRCKVKKVSYSGTETNGILNVKVQVELTDGS